MTAGRRSKRDPTDGRKRQSARGRDRTERERHPTWRRGVHRAAHADARPPGASDDSVVLSESDFPEEKLMGPKNWRLIIESAERPPLEAHVPTNGASFAKPFWELLAAE